MWPILKVFIEFVTILLLFYIFGFFGHKARGILAHCPGTEPAPPALEGEVPTTGLSGKSHHCCSVAQSCPILGNPWTAALQASLSFTISLSLLKLKYSDLIVPSNYLILCHPLLLLPSISLNIRVFSNESAFHIRWPKCWSFSFSISPSNEYSGLVSFRMDWFLPWELHEQYEKGSLKKVIFNLSGKTWTKSLFIQ